MVSVIPPVSINADQTSTTTPHVPDPSVNPRTISDTTNGCGVVPNAIQENNMLVSFVDMAKQNPKIVEPSRHTEYETLLTTEYIDNEIELLPKLLTEPEQEEKKKGKSRSTFYSKIQLDRAAYQKLICVQLLNISHR